MTRSRDKHRSPAASRGPNLVAALISFAAVGILYFNFDPTAADADTRSLSGSLGVSRFGSPPPPALPERVSQTSKSATAQERQGDAATNGITSNRENRLGLLLSIMLLERGVDRLEQIDHYSATFFKQERVNGSMTDGQVMETKFRHKPYSVYMRWLVGDKGRELLYVDGQNDGRMMVHAGGWKARLLPALKLEPTGSLAMSESRHPITKAGLLELARTIIDYRKSDLEKGSRVRSQLIENAKLEDQDHYCLIVEYNDQKDSPTYRKSVIYIDKQNFLPVTVQNYGWESDVPSADPSKLDETTLLEHYAYKDIRFDIQMADADFEHTNSSYKFRR